jgi:hypothetical protein
MDFDFDHTTKVLSLIGGFAGFTTLLWRLWDVWKAFLHITVTVEPMQGARVKIRTVVENTNTIARKIDAAFLIVGPENEGVDVTVDNLLSMSKQSAKIDTLNDMVQTIASIVIKNPVKLVGEGRMIIPLAYYYDENVDVADENLSYEQTISIGDFPRGTYSVRFYVEARPRLHRVVHAAFEVEPADALALQKLI